eukprot:g35694.t1
MSGVAKKAEENLKEGLNVMMEGARGLGGAISPRGNRGFSFGAARARSPSSDKDKEQTTRARGNSKDKPQEKKEAKITKEMMEDMREQLVTFMFESADVAAIASLYKLAKSEKHRMLREQKEKLKKIEEEKEKQEKEKAKQEEEDEKQRHKDREEALETLRARFEKGFLESSEMAFQGWVLAKTVEVIEQDNPLVDMEVDKSVLKKTKDVDLSAKKIATLSVKWIKLYLLLNAQGLAAYKEEPDPANPPKAERQYHLKHSGTVKTFGESRMEFEVKPSQHDDPVGFRVLDPSQQSLWIVAFESYFKALKKKGKKKKESSEQPTPVSPPPKELTEEEKLKLEIEKLKQEKEMALALNRVRNSQKKVEEEKRRKEEVAKIVAEQAQAAKDAASDATHSVKGTRRELAGQTIVFVRCSFGNSPSAN